MSSSKKLIKQAREIFTTRGLDSVSIARQYITQEKIGFPPLQEALAYFLQDWNDVLHPGLISLACEAAGGDPKTTTNVGAAIVLLAGGADIHDDIIDQSRTKSGKMTVYGKFGTDIAILAGNILLFKGTCLINEACYNFTEEKRRLILDFVKKAFFDVSAAEAKETKQRRKIDLTPESYLNIIEAKVAVAELTMRLGAVLGGASPSLQQKLVHYGRTVGILYTIRDEFIDVFETAEIRNRNQNECLPLPVLFAFKDSGRKRKILSLLDKSKITRKEVNQVVELVLASPEVQSLKSNLLEMVKRETETMMSTNTTTQMLSTLLRAAVENL